MRFVSDRGAESDRVPLDDKVPDYWFPIARRERIIEQNVE